MITDKTKALFHFIDFLHGNIEKYKEYDNVMSDLHLLDHERNTLENKINFAEKLKYDEIQETIKQKFSVIESNILNPFKAKVNELKICDLKDITSIFNKNIGDIKSLKENFSKKDVTEILRYNSKYIEFRTVTKHTYFQDIFFNYFDRLLKILFDFFNENNKIEFRAFEVKSYTIKEDYKKIYFKDIQSPSFPFKDLSLVPDYYKLIEAAYIENQKVIASSIFNEAAAKERFKLDEIDKTIDLIKSKHDESKRWGIQPKFIEHSISIFEHYLQWLQDKTSNSQPNKKLKIEAPVIRLFCAIVHQSKVIVIVIGDEGAIPYCKKVCKAFNLNYTDNVRKYFVPEINITKHDQKKHLSKVMELILPNIEPVAKKQIENYLQSKNLYA